MTTTLRVDFHAHTNASPDSLITPQQLIDSITRCGLDKVVVTDHNTIKGALEAKALAPDRIIIGEEVKTLTGELLAAFVTQEVPAGLPYLEALHRLKAQGAFICVSHPFDPMREHWSLEELDAMQPDLDAVEIWNARCILPWVNSMAKEYAKQRNLPGLVGSDSHSVTEIGRVYMEMPAFENASELRQSIRKSRINGKHAPLKVHFLSRWANLRNKSRSRANY